MIPDVDLSGTNHPGVSANVSPLLLQSCSVVQRSSEAVHTCVYVQRAVSVSPGRAFTTCHKYKYTLLQNSIKGGHTKRINNKVNQLKELTDDCSAGQTIHTDGITQLLRPLLDSYSVR